MGWTTRSGWAGARWRPVDDDDRDLGFTLWTEIDRRTAFCPLPPGGRDAPAHAGLEEAAADALAAAADLAVRLTAAAAAARQATVPTVDAALLLGERCCQFVRRWMGDRLDPDAFNADLVGLDGLLHRVAGDLAVGLGIGGRRPAGRPS